MNQKIHKLMYILGTAFLLLGTITNAAVSIVNASTVNTTMLTSSSIFKNCKFK